MLIITGPLIILFDIQDARFKQEGRAALEALQNLVRNDGWTLERSTVSVINKCTKAFSTSNLTPRVYYYNNYMYIVAIQCETTWEGLGVRLLNFTISVYRIIAT